MKSRQNLSSFEHFRNIQKFKFLTARSYGGKHREVRNVVAYNKNNSIGFHWNSERWFW